MIFKERRFDPSHPPSAILVVSDLSPNFHPGIAYNVIFNGGSVDLSSGAPVQIIAGTGTTPATGTAFPIEFTVGTLSGDETAESYSDVINVEVTAN